MTLGADPYTVLGVPRGASAEEIARARRRLSRALHPDVNPAPDAAARFDEVQRAYQVLSAGQRRDGGVRADRVRVTRDPGGGYGPGGAGAPGIFLQPATVNFGRLTPARPRADARVTLAWTGADPARLESSPGGAWWACLGSIQPATSCVVFYLRAHGYAGTPSGRHHAVFTVIVDDAALTVDLTAEIEGEFPPGSQPDFTPLPQPDDGSRQADLAVRLIARIGLSLVLVLVIILIAVYR